MARERELWTPQRVLALQSAFRDVDPLMTDERFAQDVLRVAPRSLYLWKRRPGMQLRPATQRALTDALGSAPPEVVARFDELTSGLAASRPTSLEPGSNHYRFGLVETLSALGATENETYATPYDPSQLAGAILDWISTPKLQEPGSSPVNASDVEHVRATTRALDSIERTMGGADCRRTATRFLHDIALPLLNSPHPDGAHAELFSAVAELGEVVGWMAYDAGEHGIAQFYFTHSLRLTRESGDDALAAYLMTSLTHQALFVDNPRDALRISTTAVDVAQSAGNFQVVAESELLSARALAQLGDTRAGSAALTRAERAFLRREHSISRPWASQWNETIFASHAGTTWLRLGNTEKARGLMRGVWDASSRHPRRRVYAGAELGIAAARAGDVDEAAQMARRILPLVVKIDSKRARHHLGRLVNELTPHSATTLVQEVLEDAATVMREDNP